MVEKRRVVGRAEGRVKSPRRERREAIVRVEVAMRFDGVREVVEVGNSCGAALGELEGKSFGLSRARIESMPANWSATEDGNCSAWILSSSWSLSEVLVETLFEAGVVVVFAPLVVGVRFR